MAEGRQPYTRITDWQFVDAHAGEPIGAGFKMLEHYEWDPKAACGPAYVMVRHYQLPHSDVAKA